MKIARNILGVVVGYLIFAVSAVLLFKVSGIDPHVDTSFVRVTFVILFGAIFSFIGGFVAKAIAATPGMTVNYVLALLTAGFATFSMLKSPGNHYTQIAAILLFAPMSVCGGLLRAKFAK